MDPYVQQLVTEAPALDVHSHQGTNGVWQARDLWEILSYHWLAADLRCAGCPAELFQQDGPDDRERVRRAAPYVKAARNTVNYWCFQNLARDLYGFRDEYLDEGNCDWLWDAVAAQAGDPAWETHVLDQARVERIAAPRQETPHLPERYFPYEYGEYLFCPGARTDTAACLARMGGEADSAGTLAAALDRQIRSLVAEHGIRALHVWMPLTVTYTHAEEGQAEAALTKSLSSARLTPLEQDQLASFTAERAAEVCGELGVVIQLFCGSLPLETQGPQVSVFRPEWLRALVPLIARYPQTNFDLFLATRLLSHEATVLSRNYPNLLVSGAWWQAFTPSTLSVFFRDRLEMLPMTKWNAFYSDGYCAEWVYGKSLLTRNRLTVALSAMLEEGLVARGALDEIARCVLHDNAARLYLGEGPAFCSS
jgi:hypothetical protein